MVNFIARMVFIEFSFHKIADSVYVVFKMTTSDYAVIKMTRKPSIFNPPLQRDAPKAYGIACLLPNLLSPPNPCPQSRK